jgi:PBP1b-binding outer membrane lipoprotein LpoB
MNISFMSSLVLSAVLLGGCNEDIPSEKLSSEVVRKFAESGLAGVEISDFQRDNGWVDTQTPNRYVVQYKYNYVVTRPLAEVVLALAKEIQAEVNVAKSNPGFMGLEAAQASLDVSLRANQWIVSQGDKFVSRRDSFLGSCSSCVEYWNSEEPSDDLKLRRESYVVAWAQLENLGFSDSTDIGDTVPRQAWAAFKKTEKGWVAAN